MKCSKAKKFINDYVDNRLEDDQVLILESHLQGCKDCRDLLGDMEAIVNNAKELGNLNPSEDLWNTVKRQVLKKNREGRTHRKVFSGNFFLFPRVPAFALSTLLAIMILIPLLYYVFPHRPNTNIDPDRTALINYKKAEQEYQSAIEALDKAIEARKTRVNPELMAVFKRNLAIIDESIRSCKESIRKTPELLEANRLLLICYRKKVELLNEIKDIAMQS